MIQWEMQPGSRTADESDNCTAGSVVCSTGVYYGSMRDIAAIGILSEVNELAARGVRSAAAAIRIGIPPDTDKSRFYAIRNHGKKAGERLQTEGFALREMTAEGRTESSLRVPAVTVTVLGQAGRGQSLRQPQAQPGQDVVYAGWAGLEGMIRIIGEREGVLRERFTSGFLRQMKAYGSQICGLPVLEAAEAAGVSVRRQVSEGGILASLWDLAKETGCGLELDMRKISVRQETIEVCEFFRLNPYQLTSHGSFLLIAENGEAVADALKRDGIQAAVIGRLTSGNDKLMHNGEEIRYLDRPAPDELMKLFGQENAD